MAESRKLAEGRVMTKNHLVIGLGGTGAKIIREFRKRLHESGGRVDGFLDTQGANDSESSTPGTESLYEYLYVDSTKAELTENKALWKVPGANLILGAAQTLIYDRSGSFETVVNNAGNYPNIKSWIEPVAAFGAISPDAAGAAQRRKLGRLLFAQNIKGFQTSLRSRYQALRDVSGSASVDVHIVCGLAGGTGSGALIDVICQTRQMIPNGLIKLYCFVPELNSPWGTDDFYYVNGYAALSELNGLSTGRWIPHDVGSSEEGVRYQEPSSGAWFNGCFLISDESVSGQKVSVRDEVPRIFADYLFQSTTKSSEPMDRAEKCENGSMEPECSPETPEKLVDNTLQGEEALHVKDLRKKYFERSKRFMTFGISRLEIPEEKITNYLLYNFAKTATLQLKFNNWQDTGYADYPAEKDLREVVSSADKLLALNIDTAALKLERPVLSTDEKRCRSAKDYWQAKVDHLANSVIQAGGDKKTWAGQFAQKCEEDFNLQFRKAGVKPFYEAKKKSKKEYADFISNEISRSFFEDWKMASCSLTEIDRMYGLIAEYLGDRKQAFQGSIQKLENEIKSKSDEIQIVRKEAANSGFIGDLVADKQGKAFTKVVGLYKTYYEMLTDKVAMDFAIGLIDLLVQNLNDSKNAISDLSVLFNRSAESFQDRVDTALATETDFRGASTYNKERVESLNRKILRDPAEQQARMLTVRNAILEEAGKATNFETFAHHLDEHTFINALERVSKEVVISAHDKLASDKDSLTKVLKINIIDQLFDELGNEDRIRDYLVRNVIHRSQPYMKLNGDELGKPSGKTDRQTKNMLTFVVYMPECSRPERYAKIKEILRSELSGGSSNASPPDFVSKGVNVNELVICQIQNILPLRYFQRTAELAPMYRRMMSSNMGPIVHMEGVGEFLPPLFVRDEKEIRASRIHFLLLGYLMGLISEIEDSRGEKTLAITYDDPATGLPTTEPLGKSLDLALESIDMESLGKLTLKTEQALEKVHHRQEREELFQKYAEYAKQKLSELGGDTLHPRYKMLQTVAINVRKELGLVN